MRGQAVVCSFHTKTRCGETGHLQREMAVAWTQSLSGTDSDTQLADAEIMALGV